MSSDGPSAGGNSPGDPDPGGTESKDFGPEDAQPGESATGATAAVTRRRIAPKAWAAIGCTLLSIAALTLIYLGGRLVSLLLRWIESI